MLRLLINLVIKDFMLMKKYLLFLVLFALAAPIVIASQTKDDSLLFLMPFYLIMITEIATYLQVSKFESISRGAAFICATPYTRRTFIEAKYLFVFVTFVGILFAQIVASFLLPSLKTGLNLNAVGAAFLMVSLLFGVLIPCQIKFGFDVVRWIFFGLAFLIPFSLGPILRWYQSLGIHFSFSLPVSQTGQILLMYVFAVVITFVSMYASIKIYEKKDL
ncbi:ABC-2 transporter permease [Sporolactobacillus vineae]|uniref:ABC-2 transporter permease n=1 Tax=Sporolactobacillus vineae TaxID=444463 RepID=UPI002009E14B|nr:ABC-2 transporter permease [Sporolactobacillus vineae]